ncbi:CHAT domain-containing protein [Daldinia sp. FL1419]|nr:CHAT domain-containing protein [Daldinia sp. FL1419]
MEGPGDSITAVPDVNTGDEATPISYANLANDVNNLGNLFARRYEQTGLLDDLQHAIILAQWALDMTSKCHPDRAGRLINLGNWLGRRFERTGTMEDLEKAISLSSASVELTPARHLCRAARLTSLGNWLARRHERTGNLTDLQHAIGRIKEAMRVMPEDDCNQAVYLASLGNMLALLYKRTGVIDDISWAIFTVEHALASIPDSHPSRMNWLSNLGIMLTWKYGKTRILTDLQYAINCAREALYSMPINHPNRAAASSSLGDLLFYRYEQDRAVESYNDCLACYKYSWACDNAPPVTRIRAAHKAAMILLEHQEWGQSSLLLTKAVYLLLSINRYCLDQRDQQNTLKEFAGLTTLAASATLLTEGGFLKALRLLELGRGVISRLRLGVQLDFVISKPQCPGFPQESTQFQIYPRPLPTHLLDLPGDSYRLLQKLENPKVTRIWTEGSKEEPWELSGLETYLFPFMEDELKEVSSKGPVVVINTSTVRCDALLLEPHATRSMPLPKLHYKDIVEYVKFLDSAHHPLTRSLEEKRNMFGLLEWLWDTTAQPILEALGFQAPPEGDKWPRVWWIPTGLMSLLPLHAAGLHHTSSSEAVIDRVISSYSPSLRALVQARKTPTEVFHVQKEAFLVSMETTPDCPSLSRAKEEIKVIDELLPPSASRTKLEAPCKEEVIYGLKRCNVFHFAGHSISDQIDPSKSCLLLLDWQEDPLTFEDIIYLKLGDSLPFLAYLSACSTGANSAERLHDESINLMTACQLAGFRHTIGSLWDVYDVYSVDAAREFYKVFGNSKSFDDEAVTLGVHSAARYVRHLTNNTSQNEGDPFAWAAYIHMGP